jgi:hypothetical protein
MHKIGGELSNPSRKYEEIIDVRKLIVEELLTESNASSSSPGTRCR